MTTADLKAAVTGAPAPASASVSNPLKSFQHRLETFKPQLEAALPKHLNADRMARLALTSFSLTPHLDECDGKSILASLMTAGQLGLEPGVNGQGWLIPYWNSKRKRYECQFVPGWKGLGDLVSRSGRAGAWTGAVYKGDQFDYALGDKPFVFHKPGDSLGEFGKLTHVYAVGRVNGAEWPVVEVWPIAKVWAHRDKYNRQGEGHYSYREPEMYARKVPFLQVLKYLPASIELAAVNALMDRQEQGLTGQLDTNGFVTFGPDDDGVVPPPAPPAPDAEPPAAATSPAPRPRAPKPGKGGAAVDAAVKESPPAAAAAGPGFTAYQYRDQVLAAKNRDDAAMALDLARSELPATEFAIVSTAFAEKFPTA